MKTLVFMALLLAWPASIVAQDRDKVDGVILFRRDIKFILKEPDGWVLDTQSGRDAAVEAVLYPKGSSWKNSVVVMYARVVQKDETQSTVEKEISKDSTVADSPSLPTRDKRNAIVKVFYDAANKNYESVAFIDNQKVVVVIALSSRTKVEYEKALRSEERRVGKEC